MGYITTIQQGTWRSSAGAVLLKWDWPAALRQLCRFDEYCVA